MQREGKLQSLKKIEDENANLKQDENKTQAFTYMVPAKDILHTGGIHHFLDTIYHIYI